MKINEIFSASQGEGPEVGTPTVFVRLSGCNLLCKFCDTKYHTEGTEMSCDEIFDEIKTYNIKHITFTGGEPTLQNEELVDFIGKKLLDYKISIETNGTIIATPSYDKIVISPKKQGLNLTTLKYYSEIPIASFKFIYENKKDLWWEKVIKECNISKNKVYIMAEGETKRKQLKKMPEVIEYCLRKKYKFSPRLHVLAYDTKRRV